MRTTVDHPEADLAAFDAVWQAEGLESRSRAVREYTEAHTRQEGREGEVAAVLAFDYEHHAVIRSFHDVQHDYRDVRKSLRDFRASRIS